MKVIALAQGKVSSLLASLRLIPPFQQLLLFQMPTKGKKSLGQFSHRDLERREKFWEGRDPQLKPLAAHDYPFTPVSCAVTF